MPPAAPPEPQFILRGHRAAVQCLAFLPSSDALAAGDAEGELKLWHLPSQRATASIRAHESTSGILQVACPASRPWVISQGRDGVVKCWELQSGSSLNSEPVLQLSSGCYNFCRFALLEPLQSSSSCCTPSQQPVRRSQAQQTHQPAQVLVDGFATDSAKPAADSNDNKAAGSVRNQADSQQQHQLAAAAAVEEGLLSQQFRQTAASQQQQQQQESLCQQVTDLSVHSQAATTTAAAAAEAPEPGEDLTEDAEEQLMLRNAAAPSSSNSEAATAFAAGEGAASGPCHLALPSDDAGNLGIWQLGAGASAAAGAGSSQRPQMLLAQRKGPDQPHRGQCMAVVLLQPQGSSLHALTGYEDGSVALWDTRNPSTYLAAQRLHTEPVMCLAAAANCSSGFSGSADSNLAAFDVDIPKGQLRVGRQLALPQQGLSDVAIRPDGRIAATAGWDAKVRVWDVRRRQPLALLRWHSQQVACVGFSRDSMCLAAGGRDNFISLWSLYPPT